MDRWEIIQAVNESNLSPSERLVMHVLENLTDHVTGEIPDHRQPSLTDLSKATGQGRSTVVRALDVLESGDEKLERGGGWVVRSRPTKVAARERHEITRYQIAYDGLPCEAWRGDEASPTVNLAQVKARFTTGLAQSHHEPRASPTVGHKGITAFTGVTTSNAAAAGVASFILENLIGSACTAEEATLVAAEIQTRKQPKNLAGLVRKLAVDGDLVVYLDTIRDRDRRVAVAHALAFADTQPPCEHGNSGGDLLRPDTNEPICANCRHQARQVA